MKKYITGLCAVLFALALTAFQQAPAKTVKQNAKRTDAYYYLTTNNVGDEADPLKWNYIVSQVPGDISCPDQNDDVLCTILAPIGSGGHPNFTGITDPRSSELVFDQRFKPEQ